MNDAAMYKVLRENIASLWKKAAELDRQKKQLFDDFFAGLPAFFVEYDKNKENTDG